MPSDLLLEATGLVKHFAGRRVVDGVGVELRAGMVLGLLGPNGAGKTTTLRMLSGFIPPDAGSISYFGRDFAAARSATKRLLGICSQEDTLDQEFPVAENLLRHAGYFRPRVEGLRARVDELLDTFGLRPFAGHRPEELSGGFRRRLMIARAVVHRPRVLFLDEPTTGLDPQARVALWQLVNRLRGEGLGIILTTHYMDEAERLSDDLLVLADGRITARGQPRTLLGALLGEHVAVYATGGDAALEERVAAWRRAAGASTPAPIMDEWHLPLRAAQLAAFAAAFPGLALRLREPTLDDLFLKLARDGEGAASAAAPAALAAQPGQAP